MVQNYNFVLQLTGALVEVELSDLGLSPYSSYSIKGRDCGTMSSHFFTKPIKNEKRISEALIAGPLLINMFNLITLC